MKNKILFAIVLGIVFVLPVFVFASNPDIAQINFTSPSQTIDPNILSGIFSVQTQNANGESLEVGTTTNLIFSSSSTTGQFYNANATGCTTLLDEVPFTLTMNSNWANKNFCYIDSTPGTYILTISAENETWTPATQDINVNEISLPADTIIPVITLIGETTIDLNVGDSYVDAGATALDDVDGDITSSIIKSGTYIDTSTAGTYTITYDVSDNAGNPATQVIRTVTVSEVSTPPSTLSIDTSVDVPSTCEISDTDNVSHTYTASSTNLYLGICALKAALDSGSISSVKLSNQYPSMGLFVTAFNDTEADSNSQYWALYQNDSYAELGISTLPISVGDVISFKLSDFSGNETNDTIVIRVRSLINDSTDTTIPIITLNGDANVSLNVNDTYIDAGATATDETDGDITSSIIVVNNVDTTKAGSYAVTYDVKDTAENSATQVTRTVTVNTASSGSSGGIPTATFDVQDALTYLKSTQSDDGSFGGSLMYTDWAAIAFGALNVTGNHRDNILAYFNSNNEISPTLTDNERRAMALLSLGQNPYSFNGANYIYAILSSFDGAQFGDFNLVNDDIFALIPLASSGYSDEDEIIKKDIAFIISKQNTDGSWENNVDLTAAAIQALNPFESVAGVSGAINKASAYLQNAQSSDGGWGNIYSTSWAMQAESALGISWSNSKTGLDYLATQQTNANNNGSVLPTSATLQNNIWATSYAIAAASGKSWSEIMQSVSKPAIQDNSSDDVLENINPQTPTEETPLINLEQANSENITAPTPDTILSNNETNLIAVNEITSSDLLTNTDNPEIIPDALTAIAVKTLPTKTIPHTVPIIIGTLSGLVLFYLVFKFWLVK